MRIIKRNIENVSTFKSRYRFLPSRLMFKYYNHNYFWWPKKFFMSWSFRAFVSFSFIIIMSYSNSRFGSGRYSRGIHYWFFDNSTLTSQNRNERQVFRYLDTLPMSVSPFPPFHDYQTYIPVKCTPRFSSAVSLYHRTTVP